MAVDIAGLLLATILPWSALVVTTTADEINGDVSNPAALRANPGQDGISLREAIAASNASAYRPYVTFENALSGQTLILSAPLRITAPVIIDGFLEGTLLAVTIDTGQIAGHNCAAFLVDSSLVTISRLHFTRVVPGNPVIQISSGAYAGPCMGQAPSEVHNIAITDNDFDNGEATTTAYAISMGMDHAAQDGLVTDVLVARNRFHHFQGEGTTVHLGAGGNRGVIRNVRIESNRFTECMFAVELVNVRGSDNLIADITITHNTFLDGINTALVVLNQGRPDTIARGNLVENVLFAENTILRQRHWAAILNGGFENASQNRIENVTFLNNVISDGPTTDDGGILILGGDVGGSSNRVESIALAHNTIVNNGNVGVSAHGNPGGENNSIGDVKVVNSIFWMNGGDFGGEIEPADVSYTLTNQAGFSGVNHNISGTPEFAGADDYHLSETSPAVNHGSAAHASEMDRECRGRDPLPDLGAFELTSTQTVELIAGIAGSGGGQIELNPSARSCRSTSIFMFDRGDLVIPARVPSGGSRFAGMSGDEECALDEFTITRSLRCIATFHLVTPRRRSVRQ